MNPLALLRRFRRLTPIPKATRRDSVNLFADLGENWVLSDIADSIIRHSEIVCNPVHHLEWEGLKDRPEFRAAGANFFIHYALYRDYLRRNPAGNDIVFFTHFWPRTQEPSAAAEEREEMLAALRQARLIISMSSHWKRELVKLGIPEERIGVEVVAADPARFFPQPRARSARPVVGFVSGFKENKNEAFIREAVLRHPECDWVLLGRHWSRSGLLAALAGAPNFRYLDRPEYGIERWPEVYRTFDVFVSPSLAEGGPVPLLEAMLTGVWPLATRTGHAEDVIRDGENGSFFDPADALGFDRALADALRRTPTPDAIRASAMPWSWDRFGKGVNERLKAVVAREAVGA